MKFILKSYHRDASDTDLIDDLKIVAFKLNKTSITQSDYNCIGKYCAATFKKRFGSWSKSIELAGLEKSRNLNIPSLEMIEDLQNVSRILGKNYVSVEEYDKYGKFSSGGLAKRFDSWAKALDNACLQKPSNSFVSELDLFKDLMKIWTTLGRQPTPKDLALNKCYSISTYSRRFGSWRKALESFVLWANRDDNSEEKNNIEIECYKDKKAEQVAVSVEKRNTSRYLSDRLRFKVLLRDNFSCKSCGASPANSVGVLLHVDHIIPWSKGGETVLENLETKCSKCNLGKGNAFDK